MPKVTLVTEAPCWRAAICWVSDSESPLGLLKLGELHFDVSVTSKLT